ncbi:hypothetical protein NL676_014267 [Syzygium grande]|nr:hypothetical protein NL676_014267 [Syzygium grande]
MIEDKTSSVSHDNIAKTVSSQWKNEASRSELGLEAEASARASSSASRGTELWGGRGRGRRRQRPQVDLTFFLFTLFNENKKPGPSSEHNYDLFYPNEDRVYDIPFTVEGLKNYHDSGKSTLVSGRQKTAAAQANGEGGRGCLRRQEVQSFVEAEAEGEAEGGD